MSPTHNESKLPKTTCFRDPRPGGPYTSRASQVARDKNAKARFMAGLNARAREKLLYSWDFWARAPQLLTVSLLWKVWVICAGRGFGKTRSGAEAVRMAVEKHGCRRIALIARTASDARDVMVEGPSGILAVCPPWNRPKYERSKRRLTWPNGAIATVYSADNPDLLRGPEHDFAWCDELAAWRYVDMTWSNLVMGMRLKSGLCRIVVTTTPRPTKFLKELLTRPSTMLTCGTTYDNLQNMDDGFRESITQYEGTSLGRQELYGEILTQVDGAYWGLDDIEKYRIRDCHTEHEQRYVKIVAGVDPATTDGIYSDETGIVICGLTESGHAHVIADYSCKRDPASWAKALKEACDYHQVDKIVVETNLGGLIVAQTIRAAYAGEYNRCPYIEDMRSEVDKSGRAEPIAAIYKRGWVHHVGRLDKLEDEMCTWVPFKGKSPNRIDALVFALNDLFPDRGAACVGNAGPTSAFGSVGTKYNPRRIR